MKLELHWHSLDETRIILDWSQRGFHTFKRDFNAYMKLSSLILFFRNLIKSLSPSLTFQQTHHHRARKWVLHSALRQAQTCSADLLSKTSWRSPGACTCFFLSITFFLGRQEDKPQLKINYELLKAAKSTGLQVSITQYCTCLLGFCWKQHMHRNYGESQVSSMLSQLAGLLHWARCRGLAIYFCSHQS